MHVVPRLVLVTSLVSAAALAQDGGVAKVISPFPTDAQCVALGSIRQPLSFGPGESLEFDLDALGAKAGTMTMRVLPPRDGLLPVEVHAKTNTFFSKVRRVDGTATSYLVPKTLRPQRYYEDAHENEWHRISDVTFRKNRTAKLISTTNGQMSQAELTYGNDVSDVAGAVFLMRQLELTEGKRLCFDVYGIRRIWRVWGTVQPKEHVSLPVGEFDTWHLAGEAARHDWQDARRDIHVWITADDRRLPIAALGSIDLGAVRATLTSYTRPGDKAAKAENKGNLKW
jgi:hypothetical protein